MNLNLTVQKIDSTLAEIIQEDLKILSSIKTFLIQNGGKRIRPLLLVYLSKLSGYKGKSHWTVGAIAELIHAASLLHDDVVDNAETRRGKPTVARLYGNKTAILTGDYLLACGIHSLNQLESPPLMEVFTQVIRDLAVSELLQMEWERNPKITESIYNQIIYGKTSSLFGACCISSAILAGLPSKKQKEYHALGIRLGNLFQKRDDCLDYFPIEKKTGKDFLKDFYNQLYTYPILVLRNLASPKDKSTIPKILNSGDKEAIFQLMDTYQVHDKVRIWINQEVDACCQFFHQFPESRERSLIVEQLEKLRIP